MRLTALILVPFVASCASVTDIRQKPVAASFQSARSVAELSNCLAQQLSRGRSAMIRTVPIDRGVLLAGSAPVTGGSTVTDVTEIEDLGDQRKITVRSVANFKSADVERLTALYRQCL